MDREKLETWLKTRPPEDTVAIAQRAALRVLPLWRAQRKGAWRQEEFFTTLPVFRALITSGVLRKHQTPEVLHAGFLAGTDANAAAAAAVHSGVREYVADAAEFSVIPDVTATVTAAAQATFFDPRSVWSELNYDIDLIANGLDPSHAPLWHGTVPEKLSKAEADLLAQMTAEYGSHQSFWHRWWAGAKSGNWLNWDLQRDIALISDQVWQSGIQPVMAEIARIEAGYDLGPPSMDQTLATMAPADVTARTTFAAVVWSFRQELPATLDALLGFCELEIERLQRKNFRDDEDREECQRQIRVLTTLHNAIHRLAPLLQTESPMTADQAVIPEKLSRLAVKALKEWPRKNMDDLADSSIRFALVGVATSGLMMMGIPASWALGCTTALFGGKKIADAVKAASDSKSLSA
jgi:hypothetical protein